MTSPVVYEFWAGDCPLYVGVTSDFARRMKEHRRMRWAIRGTTHIRLSFFQERADANAYETQRIGELRPLRNRHENPDHRPALDPQWEAVSRDVRQERLDLVFGADELGPTPTYSPQERRMAERWLHEEAGAA